MSAIEQLHTTYQDVTHIEVRLAVWERAFQDYLDHGFTCDDMKLVLNHLMRENRRMNGARFSLRLNTLLDYQYERFDAFLGEARAMERNRVRRTPAERVLATRTGGVTATATAATARPVGDVIRALREAAL